MRDNTIKAVEDALLSLYMDGAKPQTVSEIRDECHLSKTVIRKVVWHSPKICVAKREVSVMSLQYPRHVHQTRLVDAFQPSREWLVEIINKTRLELPHYIYDSTTRKGKR